jgi:protein-tyrosine-phosphatase
VSITKPSLRVLFVCTANAARSQIAEALLRHKGRGAFHVASAGSHPAARVHPMALAILREQGIEWNGVPKGFDSVVDQTWDLIITLCDRAKEMCPSFPGQPTYAHWGMPDPATVTDNVAVHRRAFEEAVMYLRQRIDFLVLVPIEKLDEVAVEQRLEAAAQSRTSGATPE